MHKNFLSCGFFQNEVKIVVLCSQSGNSDLFLGMDGYYREFCPNLASVSAPLTDLLKGDVKYVCSPICQQAFTQLKELLSSAHVLAAPWLDRNFMLQVDVSDAGAGAVLLQVDEKGIENPVSYFSKKFKGYQ